MPPGIGYGRRRVFRRRPPMRRRRFTRRRRGPTRRGYRALYRSRAPGGFMRAITNARTGGFLGIETKFFDTFLASTAVTAAGDYPSSTLENPSATIVLNSVAQGDGESDRDGRKITLRNLQVKGAIGLRPGSRTATAGAPVSLTVFIAIILDTQANGAVLSPANVYTNPSGTLALASHPFRNLQFSTRFRVLATRTITFDSEDFFTEGTNVHWGGQEQVFDIFVNLRGMTVTFSGTSGAITNITDNAIQVFAVADDATMVTDIWYNSRLRFRG